jgi:uncharacterized pyridoxamine 5'-phosphate oxidase family protein
MTCFEAPAAAPPEIGGPDQNRGTMNEVYDFLKAQPHYFLATVEGDQPRVRALATVNLFEGKLYILTGKAKSVAHQLAANPKAEICAVAGDNWLRVAATLVPDDRVEAQQSMLDAYPSLQSMYTAGDANTLVLYLKDAVATFSSFTAEPREVRF